MTGLFADQAAAFATRDREETAHQKMDAACKNAIEIIRIGREHDDPGASLAAMRVLAIAQRRASRMLGPVERAAS